MKARSLALRMAMLPRREQRKLLGTLPADKRSEMEQLVAQIRPLLAGGGISFADFLQSQAEAQVAAAEPTPPAARSLSEQRFEPDMLDAVLKWEEPSVRHQLRELLLTPEGKTLVAPQVYGAVVEYLSDKIQGIPAKTRAPALRRSIWSRFRRTYG